MKTLFALTLAVTGLFAAAAPRVSAAEAPSVVPTTHQSMAMIVAELPAELEAARCWADNTSGPCRGKWARTIFLGGVCGLSFTAWGVASKLVRVLRAAKRISKKTARTWRERIMQAGKAVAAECGLAFISLADAIECQFSDNAESGADFTDEEWATIEDELYNAAAPF